MNYYPAQHKKILISISILLLFLGACSGDSDRNMKAFVTKVKEKKPNPITAMPEFPPFRTFRYAASHLRSPFEPTVIERRNTVANNQKGPKPDLDRVKEPLESFSLESLQMVGILAREGVVYALIKDNAGLIYQVGVGGYIGKNYGQIEKISNTGLDIKEWILNSKGEWQTRNVPLRFGKQGNVIDKSL